MRQYFQSVNNSLQGYIRGWVDNISHADSDLIVDLNRYKKPVLLKLISKFVGFSIPFATRNGFRVVDVRRGYVKAFMPLKLNKNHINTMYAGALFTVAELPGGIISMLSFKDGFYPILKDFKIDFLQVAKTDVTVEFEISHQDLGKIECEASTNGKSDFVLEGEIKNRQGEIVARSVANYQLRTPK